MTEMYNKSLNVSGIEKLRNLFKQLTSSQIDTLHKHTNFRVHTLETVHGEQQLQCSSQFVQSILEQLKSSVDSVIQFQNDRLAQMNQAKENINQALTAARASKGLIDASVKPIETEIEQIEDIIEGWNRFSSVLIGVIN
jgi:cell division GTPase FtsZ